MTSPTENKAIANWETEMKLRSQVHMAVRLCTDLESLEAALEVLKREHREKKLRQRKKAIAIQDDPL